MVTYQQLADMGIRGNAVTHRLRNGRLHRCHRGVYAVGQPRLTSEGRWLAAVLASGPGALLSHLDAAVLWGIHTGSGATVHVITDRRSRQSLPGIRLHRARRLVAADGSEAKGIPVTTVARTLVDLTDMFGHKRLTRIVREADYLGMLDLGQVDACLARSHGRRRLNILKAVVQAHRPGRILRSELEHRFLELCRQHGLPEPETNVRTTIRGRRLELDCLWPDQKVVVELDGAAAHAKPHAFESDRARDSALTAEGYRALRYTWKRVTGSPDTVIAELRDTLAITRSGPAGTAPDRGPAALR